MHGVPNLKIIFILFLLDDSPVYEFYVPTFRKTLSVTSLQVV